MTLATVQPVDVPATAMSSVVRSVTGSLNTRPNDTEWLTVGVGVIGAADRIVGATWSTAAPVAAATRAATSFLMVGSVA